MGAAFGSGASGSLFGSSGSANFLSRATAVLAAVFFTTSLTLTYFSSHKTKLTGVMATQQTQTRPEIPAGTAKPAAPVAPAAQGNAGSKAGEVPK
jgi:preprotein translocase subunit SecG